jgi:hypothetical protein
MTTFEQTLLHEIATLPEARRADVLAFVRSLKLPISSPPEKSQKKRVFGSARGLIKMAHDFDAPLDDFKDYM